MREQQPLEISPFGVVLCSEIPRQAEEGRRIVALGKTDSEPCPRCETGRKIKLAALGWICSRCLDACVSAVVQSQDLKLTKDRETRARLAYELILELYQEVAADGLRMLTQAVHYLQSILEKEEARVAEHNSGPEEKTISAASLPQSGCDCQERS